MPSEQAEGAQGVILITGASSGIGREFALLAARDGEVLLVARSEDGLRAVAAEVAARGGKARWFACDAGEAGAAERVMRHLADQGLCCDILVNNAGFGLVGRADRLDADGQMAMLPVNVAFPTELALKTLPGMLRRGRGGILNVASVAAFLPGPGMAVYYATKAYLHSFSESLSFEAEGTGVRITSLCPGPVVTKFLARAVGREGAAPERSALHVPAAEVARLGWERFKAGEPLVIPGARNRIAVTLMKWLPRALVGRMVMRRQAARLQ